MRCCALICVLTLFVVETCVDMALAYPEDPPQSREQMSSSLIEFRDDRLSVKLRNVPWEVVLQELERQTGILIRFDGALSGTLSQEFDNLPLEQGLWRLLRNTNFMCFYAKRSQERTAAKRMIHLWFLPTQDGAGMEQLMRLSSFEEATAEARPGHTPQGQNAVAMHDAQPADSAPEPPAQEGVQDPLAELYTAAANGNDEALRRAVRGSDQPVQAAALELLASQNPLEAAPLAVEASGSADPAWRFAGLQALGQIDDPRAVQTLGQVLDSPDVGAKQYAIWGLANQTAPDATHLLSQALADPDPSIRVMTLEALASRGAEGQAALQLALHTGDAIVRLRATALLEQIRTDEEMAAAPASADTDPQEPRQVLEEEMPSPVNNPQ